MSVYTKKGDTGYTDLYADERVSKTDIRIETLGQIDALTSQLGIIKSQWNNESEKAILSEIQQFLIRLMTDVASRFKAEVAYQVEVAKLEKAIDANLKKYPPIDYFVLPGDSLIGAQIDLARTIARTAERRLIDIYQTTGETADANIYLNRLSDYLYTLARSVDFEEQVRRQVIKALQEQKGTESLQLTEATLTLELAKQIADYVEQQANELGCAVVIALVNPDGTLLCLHTMDGAFLVSVGLSQKKAYTAVALKMPTHELAELTKAGADFEGLEGMLDEKIVTLGGGFPLKVRGKIIGGIGVSGSTVENDLNLALKGSKLIQSE